MEHSLSEKIDIWQRAQHVNYSAAAATVILVLDWLLTFDMEVSGVWQSKWNFMNFLYLAVRYLPFTEMIVVFYLNFGYSLPYSACKRAYEYTSCMFVIGIALAEAILTLRTWALWGRGKYITYTLSTVFVVTWIAVFILLGFHLTTIRYIVSPLPQLRGCAGEGGAVLLMACYILLSIYDGGILFLMAQRALLIFRESGHSRLIKTLYTDGIMYYFYLFALSVLNILIILLLPDNYNRLLIPLQRILHSVLACRVVLHIREQTVPRREEHAETISLQNRSQLLFNS